MLGADATWGGLDVGGTIGSITDGGGYAFAGNGIWSLAALAPVPRYQPRWVEHAAGAWQIAGWDWFIAGKLVARVQIPSCCG